MPAQQLKDEPRFVRANAQSVKPTNPDLVVVNKRKLEAMAGALAVAAGILVKAHGQEKECAAGFTEWSYEAEGIEEILFLVNSDGDMYDCEVQVDGEVVLHHDPYSTLAAGFLLEHPDGEVV